MKDHKLRKPASGRSAAQGQGGGGEELDAGLGNAAMQEALVRSAGSQTPAAAEAPWMSLDEKETIPRQDMIYEHLAHRMGYGHISGGDRIMLEAWGYGEPEIITGRAGLSMTLFPLADGPAPQTAEGPRRPVLVFRGTEPTELSDLLTDTDPAGVGSAQFQQNELLILDAMRDLSEQGKVDLAGHSLGGALAQIAACAYPELVGRVVGFQSPGIPSSIAHSVGAHNANSDHQITASYHLVDGDLVDNAGRARLPGTTYIHDNGSGNPYSAHTSLMLASGAAHRSDGVEQHDHPDGVTRNSELGFSETLRRGVGTALMRGGGSQQFERTMLVRQLLKSGHYLLEEIREPDNRARLSAAFPELAAADRALVSGDEAALERVLDSPPRSLSAEDHQRLTDYVETWKTRHQRKEP
ncbi:MAG: pimeloyl-ACP methyl ester carboxylesterase [Myxococcota bacterium]|jgi:pimeloyl-ACP methyl ester carboxylesterase